MKRIFAAMLCLSAVFFISGCSSTKSVNVLDLISGKSFSVENMMGKALNMENYPKGAPSFNFGSDGKLTGNAGCNNFNGNFKLEGAKLNLDPGAMTRMACPGTGEADFLNAVKQVNGIKTAGNKLKLLNGANEIMSLIPKL